MTSGSAKPGGGEPGGREPRSGARSRARRHRRTPHRALSGDLAFLLAETSARVRLEVDSELRELGLDWSCRLALTVVKAVGGLSQEALSDRTGIDRSSLSAVVRDLEADGLLERGGSAGSRRGSGSAWRSCWPRRSGHGAREQDRHWLFG